MAIGFEPTEIADAHPTITAHACSQWSMPRTAFAAAPSTNFNVFSVDEEEAEERQAQPRQEREVRQLPRPQQHRLPNRRS